MTKHKTVNQYHMKLFHQIYDGNKPGTPGHFFKNGEGKSLCGKLQVENMEAPITETTYEVGNTPSHNLRFGNYCLSCAKVANQ